MKLLHGPTIGQHLSELQPQSIAVAYVGADWQRFVDEKSLREIVLSPTLGTNPNAVEALVNVLGWENVHFLDNLHAKIYIGTDKAAFGSFNLSANGIGADGLQEAGAIVNDLTIVSELRERFHAYKEAAQQTYPTTDDKIRQLTVLRTQWSQAVRNGLIRNDNQRRSFSAYRRSNTEMFYVCWLYDELEYTEQVISPATISSSMSFLETDNLQVNHWILCWRARKNGYPDARSIPYWLHIDEIVSNGAFDEPYTKLAIERADRHELAPPFDITKDFVKALYATLRANEFDAFTWNTDSWSVHPTLDQLNEFLDAVQEKLTAMPMPINQSS